MPGDLEPISILAEQPRSLLWKKSVLIKAAKAMDLKVAGVDIIRSAKGPLLLEVNSSPGLEGIEGATNK
jgi:ribosomal protein S6--L-glutamate ligase